MFKDSRRVPPEEWSDEIKALAELAELTGGKIVGVFQGTPQGSDQAFQQAAEDEQRLLNRSLERTSTYRVP